MRVFFVSLIAVLAVCDEAQAQGRLWDQVTQSSYLEFDYSQEFRPLAPLVADLKWNGRTIDLRSRLERKTYFLERHLARVDKGQWIEILPASWIYPEGFSLVHEIRFAQAPEILFELRALDRRDGQWIFETFLQGDRADHLVPRKNLDLEQVSSELILRSGERARFDLTRIRGQSCARCHAMSSGTEGPCGFGRDNEKIVEWRQEFKKKFGRDPMKDSP